MKRIKVSTHDARQAFENGANVYRTPAARSPYIAKNAAAGMSTWDEAARVYGGETRRSWYIDPIP